MNSLIENASHLPLWMIILLMIVVFIVFISNAVISFYTTSFLKEYRNKKKHTERQVKRLQKFTTTAWPKGVQQLAIKKLSDIERTKKKLLFISVGVFILIISVWTVMDNYFEDNRRRTYQDILRNIDNLKKSLKQKTVMNSDGSVCADCPIKDFERFRSGNLYMLEASGNGSGWLTNTTTYELSMMKQGWVVSNCREGDKDCVSLQTETGCCDQIGLKAESGNILSQYLDAESEVKRIARWEAICSWRAYIEGIDKATHHEAQKITAVTSSYKACMLEQGWDTHQCAANEQGCVKIPYVEGRCTARIRDWLEHKYSGNNPFLHLCFEREIDFLM